MRSLLRLWHWADGGGRHRVRRLVPPPPLPWRRGDAAAVEAVATRSTVRGRAFCTAGIQRQLPTQDLHRQRPLPTAHILRPQLNGAWKIIRAEDLRHVTLPPDWDARLEALQDHLGVRFREPLHLRTALIHHGALDRVPEDVAAPQRLSNRSLEFLGDAILGMAVSSFAFQSQPAFQEGQLTRLKSILVNNVTLSRVAEHDLGLADVLVVAQEFQLANARADDASYRKGRTTIQAGAVEALIAAIYVDQGLEPAIAFVNDSVLPSAIKYATDELTWQPVVELQQFLQAHGYGHPTYHRIPAPSTSDVFHVELFVHGERIAIGKGPSYRAARIDAADAGYRHFATLLRASD